jgi:hypothetical protein
MYFSSYKGTTSVNSGNCPSFSCATSSSLLMLTAGPRDQFSRWRRSRRRHSGCSVLSCSDLWLQRSVSFVQGLKKIRYSCVVCNYRSEQLKTEHPESLLKIRLAVKWLVLKITSLFTHHWANRIWCYIVTDNSFPCNLLGVLPAGPNKCFSKKTYLGIKWHIFTMS